MLIRLVTWTPQVLWAVCAASLLRRGMRILPLGSRRKRAWLVPILYLLVAYGIVLLAIGVQMQQNGIPPFPPTGGYPEPHYTAFWEIAAPSMWALAGLVFVHVFCGLQNLTAQQVQANKAAPPPTSNR